MQVSVIMHADFETPGIIEDWALEHQYTFNTFKPYQGQALPSLDSVDFLIVMGGPQSPLNIKEAPYLKEEINFIKEAVQSGKTIFGFCLGAQLIGEALGGKTERSPEKEVGVYPITLTPAGLSDALFQGFPESWDAIHWHNDMPGLTSEAQLLAFSKGCPRQAIRYKEQVYGLQFHMEITSQGMKEMVKACPEDLTPARFVQSQEELLRQDLQPINQQMCLILDRLADKIAKKREKDVLSKLTNPY